MADYRKALQKTPDDPAALNNLAFLLADSGGDTKEALDMVTKAIRKAPNVPQLKDTMAWIQIKRHNSAEALQILKKLSHDFPNDNTFRYHYAVALIESGDRAEARQQAETALSKKPTTELAGQLRDVLAQTK